jgi:hypothetical protein
MPYTSATADVLMATMYEQLCGDGLAQWTPLLWKQPIRMPAATLSAEKQVICWCFFFCPRHVCLLQLGLRRVCYAPYDTTGVNPNVPASLLL